MSLTAEIKQNVLPKDYPGIDFSKFKIILVEGSKNTLNSMSDNAKVASRKYLQQMDVNIMTEMFVKNYDGEILVGYFLFDIVAIINFRAYCCYNLKSYYVI